MDLGSENKDGGKYAILARVPEHVRFKVSGESQTLQQGQQLTVQWANDETVCVRLPHGGQYKGEPTVPLARSYFSKVVINP